MMKSAGRIGFKKASRPFKDFYSDWIETLRSTLLPLLRHSMSSSSSLPVSHRALLGGAMVSSSDLLSNVDAVHSHFQSYFQALDLAARHDVSQILFPEWRNSLEKPFLWFGDFHPALFTTLLRSFLDPSFRSSSSSSPDRPLPLAAAWKNPSEDLIARIEQIERGLRLIVPSIVQRFRESQSRFVERIAGEWAGSKGREEASPSKESSSEALRAQTEELHSVFGDANRLRSSIVAEVVGATDVYQAALYLEALAQFVVGFRDVDLLRNFEQCRMPLSPGLP